MIATVGLGDRLTHGPASCPAASSSGSPCARALAGRPRDHLRRRADRQPRLASPAPRCSGFLRRSVDEFGQTVVMVTHDPVAAGVRRPRAVPRRRPDRRRDDASPTARAGARPDEGLRDAPSAGSAHRVTRCLTMLRATLKSLLGAQAAAGDERLRDRARRRVRRRHLGLHRHPGQQLHRAVRGRPRRDVDVRPAQAAARRRRHRRRRRDRPGRAWSTNSPRCPASPGSTATSPTRAPTSSARTARSSAAAAARPAIGGNCTDAPGRGRLGRSSPSTEGGPGGARRGRPRREDRRSRRVTASATRSRWCTARRPADGRRRRWSASSGSATTGNLNGATFALFDTATAQELYLGGADAFTDIGVTGDGRRVQRGAARRGRRPRCHRRLEAVDDGEIAAENQAATAGGDLSFITTFLLVFAGGRAGGRHVPDPEHVLDHRRAAQPGAGPAARARRVHGGR